MGGEGAPSEGRLDNQHLFIKGNEMKKEENVISCERRAFKLYSL